MCTDLLTSDGEDNSSPGAALRKRARHCGRMASAEGIRIKDLIEVETEKLVKHLTGLGNSDDDLMNIETACEFADSNFR